MSPADQRRYWVPFEGVALPTLTEHETARLRELGGCDRRQLSDDELHELVTLINKACYPGEDEQQGDDFDPVELLGGSWHQFTEEQRVDLAVILKNAYDEQHRRRELRRMMPQRRAPRPHGAVRRPSAQDAPPRTRGREFRAPQRAKASAGGGDPPDESDEADLADSPGRRGE